MPFTEVVTQMPLYAKFLKDILSKKRKIEGEEFRVNGQRLKHYLGREERMEELQQVIWKEEEAEQQVQLRTQN